jgi:hypothetical protein
MKPMPLIVYTTPGGLTVRLYGYGEWEGESIVWRAYPPIPRGSRVQFGVGI